MRIPSAKFLFGGFLVEEVLHLSRLGASRGLQQVRFKMNNAESGHNCSEVTTWVLNFQKKIYVLIGNLSQSVQVLVTQISCKICQFWIFTAKKFQFDAIFRRNFVMLLICCSWARYYAVFSAQHLTSIHATYLIPFFRNSSVNRCELAAQNPVKICAKVDRSRTKLHCQLILWL